MENTVKITDIYLRGFLAARGYKSIDIQVETVDGRGTVVFVYESNPALDLDIQDFRDSTFMRAFIREYLSAKRIISQTLENERRQKNISRSANNTSIDSAADLLNLNTDIDK